MAIYLLQKFVWRIFVFPRARGVGLRDGPVVHLLGPRGDVFGCVVVVGTFPPDLMDGHGALASGAAQRISQNLGAPSGQDAVAPERKGA